MSEQHRCSGKTWSGDHASSWGRLPQCTSRGTINEDGQWWCKRHAPSIVNAKREANRAEYDRKWNDRMAKVYMEAAAPDLLACCQDARRYFANELDVGRSIGDDGHALIKRLDAAIKQALGLKVGRGKK